MRKDIKPTISKELIEYLERVFPEEIPSPNDSLQYVYFRAGKRDLIKFLRELYTQQEIIN